jgi:hypothetical protein
MAIEGCCPPLVLRRLVRDRRTPLVEQLDYSTSAGREFDTALPEV